jgi:ATP-dependent protease ClpP protease subunit
MNINWSTRDQTSSTRKRRRVNEYQSTHHGAGTHAEDDDDANDIITALANLTKQPKMGRKMNDEGLYVIDNNIYFNNDITMESVSALNKELRYLAQEMITMKASYGMEEVLPVRLHITSYGGSVHAAFSAIDCIVSLPVPVHTIVDGYAASSGTLISVCGAKRYINQNASMLIHQLRAGIWGTETEIREYETNIDLLAARIIAHYVKYTTMRTSQLKDILKHDYDWYPEQCIQKGLVDEIM